jgi:hypothetical protein
MSQTNTIPKINVLHLFEMAAGPSIQSYYYKKFGYGESWVISKNRTHPVIDYYGIIEKFPKIRNVIIEGLKRCSENVDIVFIHGSEFAVPIFKILTRKKVILQYHGSDINLESRSKNPFRIICRSMADAIIYNQKTHLKKIITIKNVKKEFHPNAVDTDLFKPKNKTRHGSIALMSNNLDREKTMKELENFSDLTIIDKNDQIIPYAEMPNLLNNYEIFVDHKITDFGLYLEALSRSALEALACGCKVYHNGRYIDHLPDENNPEVVMKKLYSLFHQVLSGKNYDFNKP